MVSANILCRHRVWCDSCKLEAVEAASSSYGHKCKICGMNVEDIRRLLINSQGPPYGGQHAMQFSNQGGFGIMCKETIVKNVAHIASPKTIGDPSWYADCGAPSHVTSDLGKFSTFTHFQGNARLLVGNGEKLEVSNISNLVITLDEGPD
ncbi:hypothetical protein QYF36_000878 [Acer negundo]|nr:hypothetical protein QYF36_000878 [Acer negundo]